MKSVFHVIIIALFGIMGCTKTTDENTASADLIGNWQWVKTSGGIAGTIQTPTTLGYTYMVTYTKEGRFLQYDKDNKLAYDESYVVSRATSILDNKERDMVTLDAATTFSFEIRNDSLFLYQEAYDGSNVTFIKK
ncbi:MAG: hypothetical protein HXX14_05750 [Bacteroidetes bacterium]|nr:hypothetical protein [Bacteroidota bacterium]